MGYIDDMRKISGSELIFTLLFISGAICPGMLAIWSFAPTVIDKSVVIFVLLSIALTLPILSVNALAFIIGFGSHYKKKPLDLSEVGPLGIAMGSCITMLSLGIPVLVAFLGSFSLKTFAWLAIGAEVLVLLLTILSCRPCERDE